MDINLILTAIVSAIVGALMQIMVARFSKPKGERRADLADKWLKIADMSADQVEERINYIATLDARIRQQEEKIVLQQKEIDGLNARIVSMQIDERAKDARLTAKIEALEQYVGLLINILRSHHIDIPPRPDVLKESSPKIAKMK